MTAAAPRLAGKVVCYGAPRPRLTRRNGGISTYKIHWFLSITNRSSEATARFATSRPLREAHDCVVAALAMESEPVDPGL